jgi:hypothetical protein
MGARVIGKNEREKSSEKEQGVRFGAAHDLTPIGA